MNGAISLARAAYYSTIEPLKLRYLRFALDDDYDPNTLVYNGPKPLISVYIPTHNRCDLLISRALKSVLVQTYRNWECIVAAHGCTDDTFWRVRELGAEVARKDSEYTDVIDAQGRWTGNRQKREFVRSVRVIDVPRKRTYPSTPENHWLAGPVVPANAALEECKGSWIARIDDDDEWTPDHLEKLLNFAQAGNYEFVSSAYETHEKRIDHDGEDPPIGGTQTWLYRSYLASFKYNRECWRKSWNRVNDTDLADRFRKAGVRIGHLNEVTARVLPRPGTNSVGLKAYTSDERATLEQLAFR